MSDFLLYIDEVTYFSLDTLPIVDQCPTNAWNKICSRILPSGDELLDMWQESILPQQRNTDVYLYLPTTGN